ncbi:MAG: hypothetical protein Ta2D_01320 [Rickettsiales bacterium]|nr:MAG: hypothetical protein Ta2D_01320 [Rickettsiales bacterium]
MNKKEVENSFKSILYYGDNLDILKKLSNDKDFYLQTNGGIDLIYIDPPFNSNRVYNMPYEKMLDDMNEEEKKTFRAQKEAFIDTWSNIEYLRELDELETYTDCLQLYDYLKAMDKMTKRKENVFTTSHLSYLTMMAHRIYYIHKLLKDTGSFYLHCDPTMSHYLKILLDMVFGVKNFKNEIIWCYATPSGANNFFSRKHDVILFYTKTDNYTFNIQRIPHKSGLHNSGNIWNKKIKEKGEDDIKNIENLEKIGKKIEDWWTDIYPVDRVRREMLNYPTQKPEALLERIIKASSKEGDLVADFFCGCGTTITAAQKLNRKFLGVDINHLAIALVEEKRLKPLNADYKIVGIPTDIAGARELAAQKDKFKFEQWIVEYVFKGNQTKKTGDGGYDGDIIYNMHHIDRKIPLRAIIEVKSGNVNIGQIRAFKDAIQTFNAAFGIFVAFDEHITKGMREEANNLGFIDLDKFKITDMILKQNKPKKMYIITIEELLANDLPLELVQMSSNITY